MENGVNFPFASRMRVAGVRKSEGCMASRLSHSSLI